MPPALEAALTQAKRQRPPCLLCGGPCAVVGVFLPIDPQAYGFPPGVHAARVYTLCAAHHPHNQAHAHQVSTLVEQHLWAERQRALAARWN